MSDSSQFLCTLTKTGIIGQEQLTFDCKPLSMSQAPMSQAPMSQAPMSQAPMPMPSAPFDSIGANQPIIGSAYRRF